MILERLESIAVHEAGHTVAALLYGVEVVSVDLLPTTGRAGATGIRGDLASMGMQGWVISLAGEAAEKLVERGYRAPERPRAVPWLWSSVAALDFDRLNRAARGFAVAADPGQRSDLDYVSNAPTRDVLRVAWARAEGVLAASWPQVYAIASALLEHGQLDGAQVLDLYRRGRAA